MGLKKINGGSLVFWAIISWSTKDQPPSEKKDEHPSKSVKPADYAAIVCDQDMQKSDEGRRA